MTTPASPLSITVTLDRRAIRRGITQRLLGMLARPRTAILALAIIALVMALFAIAPPTRDDIEFAALLLAGLAAFYVATLSLAVLFAARRTARLPGLLAQVAYTVSDDGIAARAEGGSSNLGWAHYSEARESQDFFLITLQSRQTHIIPRAQLTPAEIAALRAILSRCLPRRLRLRTD
jgi:hypothetical protein